MAQNWFEQARIECEEHGPENLVKPCFRASAIVPFERGVRAAVQWSISTKPGAPQFPGMRRYLTTAILQDRAKYGAIHGWRFGRRNPPEWAVDLLIRHLEDRATEYQAAADALRASKKKTAPKPGGG
jgi:hypothetical protein